MVAIKKGLLGQSFFLMNGREEGYGRRDCQGCSVHRVGTAA